MAAFTLQQLKDKVIELGTKYPEAVYDRGQNLCKYLSGKLKSELVPENEGCIFGQAIMELDPSSKPILEKADVDSQGIEDLLVERFGFNWVDNRNLIGSMTDCQASQDYGEPWGDAIQVLLDENQSIEM